MPKVERRAALRIPCGSACSPARAILVDMTRCGELDLTGQLVKQALKTSTPNPGIQMAAILAFGQFALAGLVPGRKWKEPEGPGLPGIQRHRICSERGEGVSVARPIQWFRTSF